MFFRDMKDFYCRTPRTLQSSKFGPYSRIYIPSRRSQIVPYLWMLAYGAAVGFILYLVVLVRA